MVGYSTFKLLFAAMKHEIISSKSSNPRKITIFKDFFVH
jgi:hypothetical protein